MKSIVVLTLGASLAMAGVSALAQPAADPSAAANPPIHTSSDMTTQPLAQGHNSFTRDQAAARIAQAGYSGVAGLTLDAQGLWQATATRDGRSVHVALDYKGNVAAQ